MASASSAGGDGTAELSSALLDDAERLYNLGCAAIRSDSYVEAVDCFSKALEIRVQCYGELGPECAQTYYKFGCALLYKAQTECDAVVGSKAGEGQSSSAAEASKLIEDDSEDEEDDKNEGEGVVADDEIGEEEESDLELAWKVLDIARVIYAKEAQRTLAEVDVITALADVSLEKELFQLCFDDYDAALGTLENLVEADNRRIAELCFKISLAKQMDQKPQEALDYCKRAISVCERRIERLIRELNAGKELDRTPGKGVEDTGKCAVDIVSDAGEVAQVNDYKLSSQAELKEVGEAEQKLVSSEDEAKCVGDGDAQVKDPKLSVETDLKAEVKEIEELLVDLRERVEELQQMAVTPSLFDALKASNPEAAAMMKQVYSTTIGVTTFGNGGSDTSQVGSSSTAPVTNLGVVGRGVKRASLTPIVDEQSSEMQPKKRTTEDVLKGGSSGETQNGHS